ncbi:MAG TPA: methylmalonyl-CoA mutase family protein, partial [Chloroflexia bacterium]|nr:methylmalonyl-CoA mutase family protein [Chloroflexia bacterium]
MADKAVINGHLEAGQNGHTDGQATEAADGIARLAEEARRWEATTVQKSLHKMPERTGPFTTVSGQPINRLYTPADLPDFDYERDLGFPGEYPFTRGVQATMYRSRYWTMR